MKYLKTIKLFEARSPQDYIPIEVIDNINDILLDLSDNGYTYKMSYYIKESDWIDSKESGLKQDEVESIIIKLLNIRSQSFAGYAVTDYFQGSFDGNKYNKNKNEYAETLKLVLDHLITYINSIDYDFNIHHNNKLLYKTGDKEMKMNWHNDNINKFVDYVIYGGGDIELCFYTKYVSLDRLGGNPSL